MPLLQRKGSQNRLDQPGGSPGCICDSECFRTSAAVWMCHHHRLAQRRPYVLRGGLLLPSGQGDPREPRPLSDPPGSPPCLMGFLGVRGVLGEDVQAGAVRLVADRPGH